MKRSPYLFDAKISDRCSEKPCSALSTRILVMVEEADEDQSDVTVRFLCDTHADAYQALFSSEPGSA